MGTFLGINVALSSLLSQQAALDTIGNNVANVNTSGYHRQEVVLQSGDTYSDTFGGQWGTGVQVQTIRRTQDAYLDMRARTLDQETAQWQSTYTALESVQGIVASSSDADLGTLLDNFWNAWEDLSANPEDAAARIAVRQQASTLCSAMRTMASDLTDLQASIDSTITSEVTQVNALAAQVAAYNADIAAATAANQQPNDLLDKRDAALAELSNLVGANALATSSGGLIVTLGGQPLVQGSTSFAIDATTGADGHVTLTWRDDGDAVTVQGGEIGGLLAVRDTYVPSYLSQLDALATNLVSTVNALHSTGYGLDGTTGNDFFAADSTAATIDLSDAVLASAQAIAATAAADAPGDGSLAASIAALRDQGVIAGQTLNAAFTSLVSDVATATQAAANTADAKSAALSQVTTQQQSLSGVSLDEELSDMIMYQQAYGAAAQLMTTINEMLATLVNQIGL